MLCPCAGCICELWGSWEGSAMQAALLWAARRDSSCWDSKDRPEMEDDDLPL